MGRAHLQQLRLAAPMGPRLGEGSAVHGNQCGWLGIFQRWCNESHPHDWSREDVSSTDKVGCAA